jgi:cytochrome c553
MTYSMKSENKLEGASNFRAWKTRIDLILAKNKVLDIVKGNILEPQFEAGKEKEPQSVATMEKFKRDMSKVQCFECHDYGHYKRNCPKLTRREKRDITHQLPMMKNPQRRQSMMKQISFIIRLLLEPLKMTCG